MGKGGGNANCRAQVGMDAGGAVGAATMAEPVEAAVAAPPEILDAADLREALKSPEYDKNNKEAYGAAKRAQAQLALAHLNAGVEQALKNPELLKEWLSELADKRLHTYSFGNYMLIRMQNPNATRVASKSRWRALGYEFAPSEDGAPQRGLAILKPSDVKVKQYECKCHAQPVDRFKKNDPKTGKPMRGKGSTGIRCAETGQEIAWKDAKVSLDDQGNPIVRPVKGSGWDTGYVYDITQMRPAEGKVAEQFNTPNPAAERCIEDMTKLANHMDIEVFRGGVDDPNFPYRRALNTELLMNPNAGGYYVPDADGSGKKVIVSRKGLTAAEEARVMSHEMGHAIFKHEGYQGEEDRQRKEVEAETLGYVLASEYGVQRDDYSPGYIIGWAGSQKGDAIKEVTQSVQKAYASVGKQLEEIQSANAAEPSA